MKNDYSFKLLGIALLAGVFLAFVNPLEAASVKTGAATYQNINGNHAAGTLVDGSR